ncbi:MAG: TlpA family protein disulfide reductase [Phycisphaerales bacterium]|nr:MAG: TlpA family protein disulfide reductase [Phycisphaerales bacterium]
MRNERKVWTVIVVAALLLEGWALYVVSLSPRRWRPALIVKDEPAARALYDGMMGAIRQAERLSYTSFCSGPDARFSIYTVRQAKPDYFSIEVVHGLSTKSATVLGDGNDVWTFWSGGRPYLTIDDDQSSTEARSNAYVRKAMRAGPAGIARDITLFGQPFYRLILDPDIFHGHADPLEPYIDGVRSRGRNDVDDVVCDVIEVSYMQAQRTRFFWIAREDHLPRRIKEVVRLADISVAIEEWKKPLVDEEIPAKTFAWSPPEDWQRWTPPSPERFLLAGGSEAPDFTLASPGKGTISLSDYRGQVVWLCLWQVGSPACCEQMRYLQSLHEQYGDRDLAILGLNFSDDRRIVRAFLKANGVTFPTILDISHIAKRVVWGDYGNKVFDVPLSYIIDREGKVVDAWFGCEEDLQRGRDALKRAGLPAGE